MSARPFFEEVDLFPHEQQEGRVRLYRIPMLVVSKRGTIFAFPEERVGTIRDGAKKNLVVRRSLDHGATWLPLEVLKSDDNPRVSYWLWGTVADQETGRVFVFYHLGVVLDQSEQWVVEHPDEAERMRALLAPGVQQGAYYLYTDDEGQSWSGPVPLGDALTVTNPVTGEKCPFGLYPGTGIQLVHGKHKGRLVMPGRGWIHTGSFQLYAYAHNFVALSDDHGATWRPGGLTQPGTGEACVVELVDGTVYVNSRNESVRFRGYRAWDRSDDGGESFVISGYDRTLVEPHCHASLVRYSTEAGGSRNRVLFCNPAVTSRTSSHFDASARRELTVRVSYDECWTWPVARMIHRGPSGYSALAVAADGTILCLYEWGEQRYNDKGLRLARFNIEWVEGLEGP